MFIYIYICIELWAIVVTIHLREEYKISDVMYYSTSQG